MAWFAVRSVIRFDEVFEERVVLFSATGADAAIARAEVEAAGYVESLGSGVVLDFQQSYELAEERIEDATELFSLMRTSELDSATYLSTHFNTGAEHQQ